MAVLLVSLIWESGKNRKRDGNRHRFSITINLAPPENLSTSRIKESPAPFRYVYVTTECRRSPGRDSLKGINKDLVMWART